MANEQKLELIIDKEFTTRIKSLLNALMLEGNLTPNERVSSLFSNLVRLSLTLSRSGVIKELQQDGTLQH